MPKGIVTKREREPRTGRTTLRGRVVVITGASSGIGRATAIAFARHQVRLVLAARNLAGLNATAQECALAGAHSLIVRTDVTDSAEVAALARKAVDAFGRIDVWINNAGVGLYGPFMNAGMSVHRRVIDTDLIGAMNGAAAALPYFRRQGSGVLIMNVSVGGFAPVPYAASYTAAKFGLRGFTAALRQELVHEPGIHVCAVFPAVIDTPGFQHGGNVSGTELRPASPVFPAEAVAAAMVGAVLHPREEIPVGWPSHLARLGFGVAPVFTERLMGSLLRRHRTRARPEGAHVGNLFAPSRGRLTSDGGWRPPHRRRTSNRTWVALGAGAALATWAVTAWMRGAARDGGSSERRTPPKSRRPSGHERTYMDERAPHARYAG